MKIQQRKRSLSWSYSGENIEHGTHLPKCYKDFIPKPKVDFADDFNTKAEKLLSSAGDGKILNKNAKHLQ